MKNSFFKLPKDMDPQAYRAFWIAMLIALAHFAAAPYYLYLASSSSYGVTQYYGLLAVTSVLGALFMAGAVLSWRGRPTLGMSLILCILAVSYPFIPSLASGIGLVLGPALMLVGPMMASQTLPRRPAWVLSVLTAVSGLAAIFLDMFGSAARPALPGIVIQILSVTVLGALGFSIVRAAWAGNIRLKLVTSFTMVALVAVAIVGISSYISYRNQLREDFRQRLLNIISLIAMQQDVDLHATIQSAESQQSDSYKQLQATNAAILATDRALTYIFSVRVDEQGRLTFVLDNGLEEGYVPLTPGVAYDDPSSLLAENALTLDHPIVEDDFYTDEYGTFLSAYAPIYKSDGTREGIIGVDIRSDNILAQEKAALTRIALTSLAALLGTAAAGFYLGYLFTKPITNLATVAQRVTDGDLQARASIESRDEVGILAQTFNTMTARLHETLSGLEQRVADRTRNLELAAEVGRSVSQVRALDVMLRDAVELIRTRFDLYYAQVYLVNASRDALVLQSGTREVGRQLIGRGHRLPLDTGSINGRAAVEKRAVVIADTASSASFRPNTLLPETRSEMAVPLLVGEEVVGVLDLQSAVANALTPESLSTYEALAGQFAIAIQNARLLAETQEARTEIEKQSARLTRANWQEYLDAIHKPEQVAYLYEQDTIVPVHEMPEPAENALSAPIMVGGETLGNLVVDMAQAQHDDQTVALVNSVARQVAGHIENLRLLESAERYRADAEDAFRRLTREGWKEYADLQTESELGYLYDLREVRPVGSDVQVDDQAVVTLPLKVREETVGRVALQGVDAQDEESLELAGAVIERLGEHIESLRQFDETKRSQGELEKRARHLSSVSRISAASSRELELAKMLKSVVQLTQREFELYHAHIFTIDEGSDLLNIMACGWKPGDVHEHLQHGEHAPIPLAIERSLVARAARTRQPVIVNDVRNEPDWLPNPNLPDTRSEMAVPLLLGDQVLGVLDVQSDRLNAFSDEDASIYTTLASQVATALQNARSYARSRKQAERESKLNLINQKIQGATSVEAVLQIAARELGQALGAPLTIAQLGIKDPVHGG